MENVWVKKLSLSRPPHIIRVLIVNSNMNIRESMKRAIENDPMLYVIGHTGNGIEAMDLARRHNPDVIVLGVGYPDPDSKDLFRLFREKPPECKTLVVTSLMYEDLVLLAVRDGVSGYMKLGGPQWELAWAVHGVADGEAYFSPQAARIVLDKIKEKL
jgi:DNA-binding NarL/FixJ family response regulator